MSEHKHDDNHNDEDALLDDEQGSPPGELPAIVTSTSDPAIKVGRLNDSSPVNPDETLVAETSHITHDVPIQVHLANVPIDRGQNDPHKNQSKNDPKGSKNENKDDHDHSDSKQAKDHQKDQRQPAQKGRSRWLDLALTAVVALVCGVGGAFAFSYFDSKNKDDSKGGNHAGKGKNDSDSSTKKDDASNSQAKNEGDSNDPNAKKPAVTKQEFDDLKQQVDKMGGLTAQIGTLQERFDSFTGLRNDTVRDIGTIQVKLKEMSKSIGDVADVPQRIQPIQEQLNRIQTTVDALSFQLAGRTTIKPIAEFPPVGDERRKADTTAGSAPILAAPMVPASPNLPDATMAAAVSFFKKGQYIQADQIFNDLQTSMSGDARVWYFSALAHGLATGKWDGETRRFVMNGADRENKGSPPATEIDAAFADLTVPQGKDWLAAYRSQLVKH